MVRSNAAPGRWLLRVALLFALLPACTLLVSFDERPEQQDAGPSELDCEPGFADCDGNAANGCEVQVAIDARNCNECGNDCTLADPGKQWQCEPSGCVETGCAANECPVAGGGCAFADIANDPNNCGACGRSCYVAGVQQAACLTGRCAILGCAMALGDCDGDALNGCEVDLRSSEDHCGGCEKPCASMCRMGNCAQ